MGNTGGGVSTANTKDVLCQRLTTSLADASGNDVSTPGRFCSSIVCPSGESIGYSFIPIPLSSLADEVMPRVALKATGPAGRIKVGTRVSSGYSENGIYVPLQNGTLIRFLHNLTEDTVIGVSFDDRLLMSKVTVGGRIIWDPVIGRYYFDETQRCVFNEFGWPNCIDGPHGPCFAPAYRFGYRSQFGGAEDFVEPSAGNATARARSWTCADIFSYLRMAHFNGDGNKRPPVVKSSGNPFLGSSVDWPSTLGNVVGNVRTPKDMDLHNDSLLIAMSKVAAYAGAYEIEIRPNGTSRSTIYLADMGSRDKEGSYLVTPDYADSTELLTSNTVIHSGFIAEDIANLFTDTWIMGDPPCVERMLSTSTASNQGAGGLEAAWDRGGGSLQYTFDQKAGAGSDEALFIAYVKAHGNNAAAFEAATKIWPLVFAAYRVRGSYDLWKGTKYQGVKSQSGRPRIRPVLVTGAQQNSNNPANWLPREIVIEYGSVANSLSSDSSWSPANRYDDLKISPDGQLCYLNALRDNPTPQTWEAPGGGAFQADNIRPMHVRFTVAVEGDWSITGADFSDPNNTRARVKKDLNWSYQVYAAPGDYVEFLRGGGGDHSWPNGKAKINANEATFPDKCTSGNELFSDLANDGGNPGRVQRHSTVRQADVNRVSNSGQLVQCKLNPMIRPGMAVSVLSDGGIKVNSIVKCVSYDAINLMGSTTIELQASNQSTIYDLPGTPTSYGDSSPSDTFKSSDTPGYLTSDSYDSNGDGAPLQATFNPDIASPSDDPRRDSARVDDIDRGRRASPASDSGPGATPSGRRRGISSPGYTPEPRKAPGVYSDEAMENSRGPRTDTPGRREKGIYDEGGNLVTLPGRKGKAADLPTPTMKPATSSLPPNYNPSDEE